MTSTNRIKILSSKPSLAFEDHQLRLLSDRSSLSQTDRPPHPQTKRPSIVSFNSQDFDFDDNCDPNSDSNSLGSDSTGNSHSSLFSLAVETQLENAKATLASLTGQLPQARHNIDQAKSQHALCERKVQRNEPQPANSMANFVTQWRSGTMILVAITRRKKRRIPSLQGGVCWRLRRSCWTPTRIWTSLIVRLPRQRLKRITWNNYAMGCSWETGKRLR